MDDAQFEKLKGMIAVIGNDVSNIKESVSAIKVEVDASKLEDSRFIKDIHGLDMRLAAVEPMVMSTKKVYLATSIAFITSLVSIFIGRLTGK